MSLEDVPISNIQIEKVLKGLGIKVYLTHLIKNKSIEELLNKSNGRVFCLLYTRGSDVGHFVLISKQHQNKKTYIEYFDPFGEIPDIPTNGKTNIMDKLTPYTVQLNKVRLQNITSSHCGRWCILRAISIDTPLHEFINVFTKTMSPDDMVNRLVNVAGI
jgi:hypothetical protein